MLNNQTLTTILIGSFLSSTARASSHRDAPAITADPYADNTDVYTFLDGEPGEEELVIIANYMPLLIPGSGPNFWRFADDVIYGCHVDNDGDANIDISYYYDFETTFTDAESFLYNNGGIAMPNDSTQQHQTTYRIVRLDWTYDDGELTRVDYDTIGEDLDQAPWYVGNSTYGSQEDYEAVAEQAIANIDGEGTFFAGPRQDYFYVDLDQTFDLLSYDGNGVNTVGDFNTMSLAMKIPIENLTWDGNRPTAGGSPGPFDMLGVYCNASRKRITIRGSSSSNYHQFDVGDYVQVSRLGLPLINEVVVGVGTKDKYMRTFPSTDVDTIGGFVLDPELPVLFEALFGVDCQEAPRTDILDLISPNGTTPADLLRIDVRQDQTAADSGMPNGRHPVDDALDVMASAACDATAIPFPVPLGDGVDVSGLPDIGAFPYLPTPLAGNDN